MQTLDNPDDSSMVNSLSTLSKRRRRRTGSLRLARRSRSVSTSDFIPNNDAQSSPPKPLGRTPSHLGKMWGVLKCSNKEVTDTNSSNLKRKMADAEVVPKSAGIVRPDSPRELLSPLSNYAFTFPNGKQQRQLFQKLQEETLSTEQTQEEAEDQEVELKDERDGSVNTSILKSIMKQGKSTSAPAVIDDEGTSKKSVSFKDDVSVLSGSAKDAQDAYTLPMAGKGRKIKSKLDPGSKLLGGNLFQHHLKPKLMVAENELEEKIESPDLETLCFEPDHGTPEDNPFPLDTLFDGLNEEKKVKAQKRVEPTSQETNRKKQRSPFKPPEKIASGSSKVQPPSQSPTQPQPQPQSQTQSLFNSSASTPLLDFASMSNYLERTLNKGVVANGNESPESLRSGNVTERRKKLGILEVPEIEELDLEKIDESIKKLKMKKKEIVRKQRYDYWLHGGIFSGWRKTSGHHEDMSLNSPLTSMMMEFPTPENQPENPTSSRTIVKGLFSPVKELSPSVRQHSPPRRSRQMTAPPPAPEPETVFLEVSGLNSARRRVSIRDFFRSGTQKTGAVSGTEGVTQAEMLRDVFSEMNLKDRSEDLGGEEDMSETSPSLVVESGQEVLEEEDGDVSQYTTQFTSFDSSMTSSQLEERFGGRRREPVRVPIGR